jgi:hypothetical protein
MFSLAGFELASSVPELDAQPLRHAAMAFMHVYVGKVMLCVCGF